MHLKNIQASNFKNYEKLKLTFSKTINCIVGINGSGKTNLLEGIYFLSLGRSVFGVSDAQQVLRGEDFFMLKGEFEKEKKEAAVQVTWEKKGRKILRLNDKPYLKISEHIGKFPCVLIKPYDSDLIREGSEMRRKFFDSILAHIDKNYLHDLISYNHLLRQRNLLLKQFGAGQKFNANLLDTYDEQILPLAKRISQKRRGFIEEFTILFDKKYQFLSQNREQVQLKYKSEVELDEFEAIFKENRERDLILQRSDKGIHKDKYIFEIEGQAIKRFGSQGQQKSYIIALKLAQFEVLENYLGTKPILLLDDIFEKIDQNRIQKLIQMMQEGIFGQVFISDAITSRVLEIFQRVKMPIEVFEIEDAQLRSQSIH
jgi:DNA replication and repair protein RecF